MNSHSNEWNGIEKTNLNTTLVRIYLGKMDNDSDEMEQSQLWNICVDILKTLTRSRRVSVNREYLISGGMRYE